MATKLGRLSDATSTASSRTITADEARKWLAMLGSPNDALCDEIAARLTRIRWPKDPALTADEVRKWLEKYEGLSDALRNDIVTGLTDRREAETDEWWDFKATTAAVTTLKAAIPKMLSHWNGLRRWPETRDGYEAIKGLDAALSAALPYIKFPFGEYKPRTRHAPKDWHMGAVVIARIFIEAANQSGWKPPSLQRSSCLVKVVQEVMARMDYVNVTPSAVSQHLIRRIDRSSGLLLPEV